MKISPLPFHDLELPAAVSEPETEYRLLREGAAWMPRPDLGKVAVTGPDAEGFLHRILSNEVRNMAHGETTAALLLTSKGRYIADLRLLRRKDGYLCDVDGPLAAQAVEGLDMYHFAEDLEIVDASEQWASWSVWGPKAEALLHEAFGIGVDGIAEKTYLATEWSGAEVLCRENSLTGGPGFDLHVPAARAESVTARLREVAPEQQIGFLALEMARIEAGRPRSGAELTGDMVPLEARMYEAIDFAKGCYVGQETIAMMDTRGKAPRLLTQIHIAAETEVVPQAELWADGRSRPVGLVTSLAPSPRHGGLLALGLVKNDFCQEGAELRIGGQESPLTGRILHRPE